MATLEGDVESVTVSLTTAEKLEAVHGDVTVPRSSIASIRAVPVGMDEVHGLRAPGAGFPGVIMVGTWRHAGGKTFAVCHGRGPAVVLELVDAPFDRIVVTVDDPEAVLAQLQ